MVSREYSIPPTNVNGILTAGLRKSIPPTAGAGFYDLEDFCPQNVSGMKKVPC